MIGQPGAQLNRLQLDDLCRDRRQELRHIAITSRDSILEKMERNANAPIPPTEATLTQLPYDVWEHILQYVNEPKEVVELWDLSECFRDPLRKRYIETRLPEILSLAMKVHPEYFYKRHFQLLLSIRFVSRQCKMSSEEILRPTAFVVISSFWAAAKLQGISAHLGENLAHINSFFPRNILIDEESVGLNPGIIEPIHDIVKIFLTLVGGHIHAFTYLPYQKKRRTIYHKFREWVALMPNLEKLLVKCGRTIGWVHREIRGLVPEENPRFARVEGFPSCPSLRCFQCAWQLLPAHFVRRIVEANAGITDLHFSEEALATEFPSQIFNALVDVTSLHICPDVTFLSNYHLWRKLKKLLFDNPSSCGPLRNYGRMEIAACVLLPILKQFEETLEHLQLLIDVHDHTRGGSVQCLHLKNLKYFKWKQHESFTSLNCLLYAEKLETLHIIAKFEDEDSDHGYGYPPPCECMKCYVDKLVGDESGSFLGKSVWEVLLCLKWIRVVRKYSEGDDIFLRRPRTTHI